MTFLKIWLKTLHRKNKRTPFVKILTNRTKLIVLLLMLVIMIYSIMYERRTIGTMYVYVCIVYLVSVN